MESTPNGVVQVIRAIRKQLKYGDVHVQKRALTLLEGLVEMGSKNFRRTCRTDAGNFADFKLVERIKYIASSVTSDPGVRRKLMLILLSWRRHFMHDPSMAMVTSLYGQCGGIDRLPIVQTMGRGTHAEHHPATDLPRPTDRVNPAMTSVDGTIAVAKKESGALLAALVRAQEHGESVLDDVTVHQHVNNVLAEQKEVVKYIHSVNDEEFLNLLVQANDVIVDALQRLQLAASGEPVQRHPLGTEPPARQDIIAQAVQRLTVPGSGVSEASRENNAWSSLSNQVDASLVANSGFTTAAPSRAPLEDYDTESDADEIDMEVAARNTRAMKGSDPVASAPIPTYGEAVQSSTTHPGAAPAIPNALSHS